MAIDPLIERDNAHLAAVRRACDAARAEARTLVEAEDVVSKLGGWCKRVLFGSVDVKSGRGGQDLTDLLTLPPHQSALQSFAHLPAGSSRQSLEFGLQAVLDNGEHAQKNLLAWLFGQALANALVEELSKESNPVKHVLPGIWDLAGSRDLLYAAFVETFAKLLCNSPSAFRVVLAQLDTAIDDINRNPGIGTYSVEREGFNAFVEEWRSKRSLVELWKARDHGPPVHYGLLDLVPIILSVDRAAVLAQLERFDFPHPIRQIFQYNTILHDRAEIAAELEAAPVCMDDKQAWNYRMSAFLLLETAEHHCHDLWNAAHRPVGSDEAVAAPVEETSAILSSWLEDLGRIVMGRPDGRFLGSQWLLLKSADERVGRARGGDPGDRRYLRQHDLIEWIACGLAKAGLPGSEIASLIELPVTPDGGNVVVVQQSSLRDAEASPRLGALSMITVLDHMIGNGSSDGVSVQLDRLDALLAARDPDFEIEAIWATDPRDLPACSCGHLFAHSGEPVARWRQSWELLVEQRQRAQHWREMQDADALAPSLFLLAAGTLCVDWLISLGEPRADHARQLWREVFDSARDCWLTVSLQPLAERIETHISGLFTRHPRVFGASRDSASSDTLRNAEDYSEILALDLARLGGDDLMLTICCLNAFHNGVTPAAMKRVLKENSGQIDVQLRQFERWQTYERRVRKRTDIVNKLDDLRTAIENL